MRILIWFCIIAGLILLLLPSDTLSYTNPQKPSVKEYARKMIDTTFPGEWRYFDQLIQRESNWNPVAQNATSTAFGLGQFLNSTWKTVGCVKTKDPYIQIDCAVKYVKARYGTPQKAVKFHNRNGFY